jgi:hypothetical protein
MIANGPISAFIPIIISGFGFSQLNSLLLLCPAGAYSGTMMLIASFLAFKFKNIRTYIIFVAQMGTVLSCLLLWKLPIEAKGGLLFATFILPSLGAGYAVLMGLGVANTAGYTKRSIASSGIYIGYCLGGFHCSLRDVERGRGLTQSQATSSARWPSTPRTHRATRPASSSCSSRRWWRRC